MSKLPQHQFCNPLVIPHFNAFYFRLPLMAKFFPDHGPQMTRIRYTPLSAARIRPSMASFASSPFSPWTSISIIPPVSAFSFMYPSPFLPYLKFIIPKCRPVFKLL